VIRIVQESSPAERGIGKFSTTMAVDAFALIQKDIKPIHWSVGQGIIIPGCKPVKGSIVRDKGCLIELDSQPKNEGEIGSIWVNSSVVKGRPGLGRTAGTR